MRNILRNALFFIILAAFIYLPGLLLVSPGSGDMTNKGLRGVHEKLADEAPQTIDTLIIGDSESYTSVSPMQLWHDHGITAYAAGEPGAKLSDVKSVLVTALEKQKPTLVMLETNVLFRPETKDNGVSGKLATALYKAFPLIKEHNAWKTPLVHRKNNLYKGFAISGKVKPYFGSNDYMNIGVLPYDIDANNITTFREIKKMCEDNGAKLLLYSSPSPVNYNMQRHKSLKALAKSEGVKYIDLNTKLEKLKINWQTDTRDRGDHLNARGAKKTTKYLGKYILKHYDLPNRRTDKCAAEWDKLYKKYKGRMKKCLIRS